MWALDPAPEAIDQETFGAQHLQVQAANIYQTNPVPWAKEYKDFWRVLNKNYTRGEKDLKINILKTIWNKPVLAIAKPPLYLKDVYKEDMGKQMNDSIIVQSWKNGAGGALKMHCSKKYNVNDVNIIGASQMKRGGILMAGTKKKEGIAWLQHSVPRFLQAVTKGYKYPENGLENGQLFFCISVPVKYADVLAIHLQVQAANVYQRNAPKWAQAYPEFWRILNKEYMRRVPKDLLKVDFLLTNKRKLVMAIAKPPNYPKDIYTQELGRQMNDSITVQSWKNGAGGAQDQHCTPHYTVTDVTVIGVKTTKGYAVFSSREDHSKWYVTRHKGVFCFSSLNRMLSQMKRGGEITCIIDIPLASLFRNSIADRNTCRNEKAE
ncbi:hypothetical protein V5799_022073 [Amblyomma americanum]|uniref:Uncharacterized protein n=1 Tax=Amblyomma americanum TaxID=6943 RepID=A0AAQ4FN30_AMBAM